jgi:plastocyanin
MIHLFFSAIVTIEGFAYKSPHLTVSTGDSVRFVNKDSEAHTVTSKSGVFDSGGLDTGDAWTYRFTKPGTYYYFCELHPYMKGSIVVVKHGSK